jgi:neutral ceramidase
VPARRGVQRAQAMGRGIAERVARAAAQTIPLAGAPITVARAVVGLPLTRASIAQLGRPTNEAEVQVITCGDLAIVALPGEPLVGIAQEIKRASPFPHTLVLGYSNGDGVEYVGLPGEKAKGGYEMGPYGLGTDECGGILVATAGRLLQEQSAAAKRVAPP